jgi:dihydroxyacid dehydratase/phosphogluconate dehydratase
MEDKGKANRGLRSDLWFGDQVEPGEAAVYLERYGNYGITREELQSGRPVIGIAQSGSDLVPCNRIHVTLAIPSARPAADPPPPLTVTLPTLAWLRSWPGIPLMV